MNVRSMFVAMLAMVGLLLSSAAATAAQDSTPSAMGYPELKVTITDQGYDLATQEVPAGLVMLTVTNNSKEASGAAVIGPPPGKTMDDLKKAVATPTAGDEFPALLYEATIPGGPGEVEPGGTAQAVVNLPAGDWAVFGEGNQPPSFFTATGAAGTATAGEEPKATATVKEVDFGFGGFGSPVTAGKQIWKVVDLGTQPHMLVLGKVPDGTTLTQVMEAVSRPEDATPPAGGLQESDFQSKGGVLLQSSDTTVWPLLDLEPGTYAALCFVPDPNTGLPHVMEGMATVFTVGS